MLAPGALIDDTPATPGPVPGLGAHTDALRDEFGEA
jgi:hypothetical protein